MPRKLRLEFPGAVYHLTNRGDAGEPIFRDDFDRERFLQTLGEASEKSRWHVLAFCLLPNHFHLVLETPQFNLVAGMKWFLGTYTNRFNRRHRQRGHVFAGRYRAVLVEPSAERLRLACEHVHLNPARAGLLAPDEKLSSYRWSSLPLYLKSEQDRPAWCEVERLWAACGLSRDPEAARDFERQLEARRQLQTDKDWAGLRRGWCFGGDAFRASLALRLATTTDIIRHGKAPPEMAEQAGERLVAEELVRLGWTEDELTRRRKTAPEKIWIARRLRKETILSLRWIAGRLRMGSVNTLRNALAGLPTEAAAETDARPPVRERGPSPSAPGRGDAVAPPYGSRGGPVAPAPGAFDVVWD
jgi:REP element-mobilizing transposase RayT